MTAVRRRRPIDIWPAFVDAIASLLMVVIFVLLVAAVGQQFLTDAILNRDHALARLDARVDELADMLSMQRAESARLSKQLALRTASLEAARRTAAEHRATIAEQSARLEQRADVIAEQKRTLDERAARAAALENDIAALTTLKERMRGQLETAMAERDEARGRLATQNQINARAQARIEHLDRQLSEVRKQLAELSRTLEAAQTEVQAKQARIDDLGRKLNLALASKAARLQRYRSEFFGRLREALAGVPGIEIAGDRFVLPARLLFESASAELGPSGRRQVAHVAETLERVMQHIPDDIDWVLRIDGHTDRRPIHTDRYPSNWELSAARAISIVRELIRYGIPADRLAATGFADNHPIDTGDTPAALARNRRIELKLTSR